MIIVYLNVSRISICPFKNNSKLAINSDRMQASQFPFQRFKVIGWWNAKVFQFVRCIQHVKFTDSNFPYGYWDPTCLLCIESIEYIFRALVSEIYNHVIMYHFNGICASSIINACRLTTLKRKESPKESFGQVNNSLPMHPTWWDAIVH
jgi:hypothetical protein